MLNDEQYNLVVELIQLEKSRTLLQYGGGDFPDKVLDEALELLDQETHKLWSYLNA